MRKSTAFLLFMTFNLIAIAALSLHAKISSANGEANRRYRGELVARLGLTDLCLFTEARYTRHLAMADNHAPFQDHPLALEHFPSGSLTLPPQER